MTNDIQLEQTCRVCPEQYDAYIGEDREKPVGYLRLRSGYFSVESPWVGGVLVYDAEPDGDGRFMDHEREQHLNAAKDAIAKWLIETRQIAESKSDFSSPIARTGEQQFACILRNRSGVSSGEIDFGARFINQLSDGDQQDAIEAVYSVYLKWCCETGKKSKRDQ